MTLDDLADLVRQGIELAIHETKSGKDITRSVLLHIILERERKETVANCFPAATYPILWAQHANDSTRFS